jgi:hypothetical protein
MFLFKLKTASWVPVLSLVLAPAFRVSAQESNGVPPDKDGYNLFNPTPDKYLREISPDRPDKTDSPFTLDAGHFQLELDYVNFTYDAPDSEHGNVRSEDYQLAPMNVKVGVLNNVDFQLVLSPYQWQRIEDKTTGAVERRSGFGDITPRIKMNLIGNDSGFFALGVIPFVKFSTAQNDLGNGAYEGGVGIPYAFNVPNWDVGFQTTVSCDRDDLGSGYHAEIDDSISIGHAVFGKLEYHVEFFSGVSTKKNSDWIGTFDTWLTYQVNENVIFDGGIYIGVTAAADDWHPWVGMTWRY